MGGSRGTQVKLGGIHMLRLFVSQWPRIRTKLMILVGIVLLLCATSCVLSSFSSPGKIPGTENMGNIPIAMDIHVLLRQIA